jgi:hypothetical protein
MIKFLKRKRNLSSKSPDEHIKKKENTITKLKKRETFDKINSSLFKIDTIDFPFDKDVMTFYRVFSIKITNDDIEKIFNHNKSRLYYIKKDKDPLFIEYDKIRFNYDNFQHTHVVWSKLRERDCVLDSDLEAIGVKDKNREKYKKISNDVDAQDFLLTDKNFKNFYYIDYEENEKIFEELTDIYKRYGISFKLSQKFPNIPKDIPGVNIEPNSYSVNSTSSIEGGSKKIIKVLYNNKKRKIYKDKENHKYIKYDKKKLLLKNIKGKYKYI